MEYKIYMTETFEKEFDKFSFAEQKTLRKIFQQLKENPFVGDAIKYKFFREKRLKDKRIYYLIYEDSLVVLLVASSGKKTQQTTIDRIISMLPEFKEYANQLFKND